LLVYHEGLFEDTVPNADIKEIAFLRLDGDLYSSTKVCMEHLYPKLVRGGWFCVDDFNLSGCRKAVLDYVVPAPVYWRIPTK
jgi:O-methyltransferase